MSVPATLKGFRTQYLYTLYVLLQDNSSKTIFIPEGKEDLDILYEDGSKEYIQVKNLRTQVTYSSLVSKGKTTSFFDRLLSSKDSNSTKGVIVSYGTISSELKDKKQLHKVLKRNFDQKIKNNDIKWLIDHIECKEVDENTIYDYCSNSIRETFPAMSTEVGIRCLLQWVYECAEKQAKITYSDLISQVNTIGKFIQDKHNFDSTFGKDIIPCSTIKPTVSRDKLKRDFLEGTSVNYMHVMENFGVIRKSQLEKISKLFLSSSIVIIHGASGQGKSTLAYQYLNKIVGSPFSYLVPNLSDKNLNDVIESLKAFTSNLNLPVTVYIDCNINDNSWIKFCQSLINYEKIRILVSIREDEWNISKNQLMQYRAISDLYLDLGEKEARDIFEILRMESANKFRSFDEAWYNYNGGSSLLEFIYMLTHGIPLKSKIQSQIDELIGKGDDESLKLLKYVSLADVMTGDISIENLRNLKLLSSDLLDIKIKKLQNEYLIYNPKSKTLRGIHPLRSKFILDAVTMGDKEEIIDSGLNLYPGIAFKSRRLFLLNLIKEGLTKDDLMFSLNKFNLSDPKLYYPILEVFIWFGIKDYIKRNQSIIDEFFQDYDAIWIAIAGLHFTDVDTDDSLSEIIDPHVLESATSMRKKLTPKHEIFDYAFNFLQTYPEKFSLSAPDDAEAIGEIMLFQSIMKCETCQLLTQDLKLENCEISQLATLLLGLKSSKASKYDKLIASIEPVFIQRLRWKYNITNFELNEFEVISKSFLNYLAPLDTTTRRASILEQHNLSILELCRRAFPDKKKYTSELINDNIISQIGTLIPTRKSISRDNLPLEEFVSIGSTLGGIVRYEHNIADNIGDYFNILAEKKKKLYYHVNRLTKLFRNYLKFFNKESLKNIYKTRDIDLRISQLSYLDIPCSSLNPWGINSKFKSIKKNINADFEDDLVKYNETVNNFFSSIRNFVIQYYTAIVDILRINNNTHSVSLATYNLQDAIKLFYKLRSFAQEHYNEYCKWTDKEEESIVHLWLSWFAITRKNSLYNFNLNNSYQNYQRDLFKIGKDIANFVSEQLKSQGITNLIKSENQIIKVWIHYSTFKEFNECGMKVINAIREKISNQTSLSTVSLIESITIMYVEVHPILCSSTNEVLSLDGGYMRYSWNSVTDLEDVSPTSMPCISSEPKWIEKHEGAKLVNSCNHVFATLSLLKSQIDNVDNNKSDQIGKDIILSYISEMEKIAINTDGESFFKLKKYINNNYHSSTFMQMLNLTCDYFIDVIDRIGKSDHSWIKDTSILSNPDTFADFTINAEIEMVAIS